MVTHIFLAVMWLGWAVFLFVRGGEVSASMPASLCLLLVVLNLWDGLSE